MEKQTIAEMIAEYLREASLLLAVFWPLDLAIKGEALTLASSGPILGIALALLFLGISIERLR